jgi:hypothetical protein
MKSKHTHEGGAVRLTWILLGIAASVALCLALAAGSASAKTIYPYEYSGTYIDGTGTANGLFKEALAGIEYQPSTEKFFVSTRKEGSGIIDKLNKNGTPGSFTGLNNGAGRDYIDLGRNDVVEISVDDSSASSKGNLYLTAQNRWYGYKANGLPIPAFNNDNPPFDTSPGRSQEQACGAAAGPNGEYFSFHRSNGQPTLQERNLETFAVEVTFLQDYAFGRPFMCNLKIDQERNFYGLSENGNNQGAEAVKIPPDPIADNAGGTAEKSPDQERRYRLNGASSGETLSNQNTAQHLAIDSSNNDVFVEERKPGPFPGLFQISQYDSKGGLVTSFGLAEGGYEGLVSPGGLTVDPATHDIYVTNNREYAEGVRHIEKFVRGPAVTVPTTDTEQATQPEEFGEATLHGVVNPDGVETVACWFEYGETESLGQIAPCDQGMELSGSANIAVTANISGLKEGIKYWVKLFAANGNAIISDGGAEQFIAQSAPKPGGAFVSQVNTDGATFNGTVDPNGGRTWFHWEYGPTTSYGESTPEVRLRRVEKVVGGEIETLSARKEPYELTQLAIGLEPGTTYHFRLVAKNEEGTSYGEDQEFVTYAKEAEFNCPNELARQQTGSAFILDCRAYELASAAYSGGRDVISSTVPGDEPLIGQPSASGRLLYSLNSAIVPGVAGDPTNYGRDPYVAVRGENGWTTEYVGLPSGGMADPGKFGSPLLESDHSMQQFAFGGENICNPCFSDGSTNIPLRRSNGGLEKGMAGTLNPAANPAGEVRKRFSADGSHFVFGAEKKFESEGNEGSVSIYERNLSSGATQVVSKLPNGSTMTGSGIAALDISSNGSRVLVGKKVGEDSAGNEFFDLYMHIGNAANTVKVVETTSGVMYNGMSSDGNEVYFTTPDKLSGDADTSNDFYVADVDTEQITRLSTGSGGTGNTNSCEPVGEWNVVSGGPNCGTVAIAGGGGVSETNGVAYFVSPELLDGAGNGEANQPNLYVVKPGQSPHFVATLDSSAVKPPPSPPNHPVVNASFLSSLSTPEAMAVDQATGDLYVLERGSPRGVSRFDSSGNPKNFTAGPNAGTNKILINFASGTAEAGVAFDNSGGVFNGDFYISNTGGSVKLFAGSGEELGTISGFNYECGVAVDQASGALYVGDYSLPGIRRLEPTSGTTPVSAANYAETSIKTQGVNPCQVAADTSGHAYASSWSNGPTKRYNASEFEAGSPSVPGVALAPVSSGLYTDPETDLAYVDERNQIGVYDPAGNLLQTVGNSETVGTNSRGVAVSDTNGHVYATKGNAVVEFGIEPVPYEPIDNPAVVHGVNQSAIHDYEDFQLTPDGRYATFESPVSVTGYQNRKHYEVYRYDATSDQVDCASCAPTLAPGLRDTTLGRFGLGLTDDGRVFFTTDESFALRDTNGKSDAYEWKNGTIKLLSSGLGPQDSALLSVSEDGKDAFFFTRDVLAPQDQNGNAIKVYDARENGGFLFEESPRPCAASDECHGAGTEPPKAPEVPTVTGSGHRNRINPNGGENCGKFGRKAKKESKRAKKLRGRAKAPSSSAQSRMLHHKAQKAAKRARTFSKKAKTCRRSSGGAGK